MEIRSSVNLGPRVRLKFPKGEGRTKQAPQEESEINNIVARYVRTGLVDHLSAHGGEYGFASSVTFHEAMNVVTKADQMFLALPGIVRRRFRDDPGEFLDFVQNPENHREMIELGLAKEGAKVPEVAPAAVVEAESPEITPEVAAASPTTERGDTAV